MQCFFSSKCTNILKSFQFLGDLIKNRGCALLVSLTPLIISIIFFMVATHMKSITKLNQTSPYSVSDLLTGMGKNNYL